jgi:hypothetical protein
MRASCTFANPSEDAPQNLQVAINAIDTFNVPSELKSICEVADRFYDDAYIAGLCLGDWGDTAEQLRQWDAQQSATRTFLTHKVERFLLRYPRGSQTSVEDVAEAGHIVGQGTTIKLLHALDSYLFDTCRHNMSREWDQAVWHVGEEMDRRINWRRYEYDK